MITPTGTAAPVLGADAFIRGEKRRSLELSEFRGTWVVLAFAVRHTDVLGLAELEEAFAAGGAIVLAATPDDWHEVEHRYGSEQTVRFPILTEVEEHRRITAIVDPGGVVRHVGLHRSARETLAALEAHLLPPSRGRRTGHSAYIEEPGSLFEPGSRVSELGGRRSKLLNLVQKPNQVQSQAREFQLLFARGNTSQPG